MGLYRGYTGIISGLGLYREYIVGLCWGFIAC